MNPENLCSERFNLHLEKSKHSIYVVDTRLSFLLTQHIFTHPPTHTQVPSVCWGIF